MLWGLRNRLAIFHAVHKIVTWHLTCILSQFEYDPRNRFSLKKVCYMLALKRYLTPPFMNELSNMNLTFSDYAQKYICAEGDSQ